MQRLLRTLGVLLAVALVVHAAWLLLGGSGSDEVGGVRAGVSEDGTPVNAEAQDRLRLAGRGLAMGPDGSRPVDSAARTLPTDEPYGSGEIDSPTARRGFEHVMGKMDEIIEQRRRLSPEEWDSLYREANDAFAALSMVLDVSNGAQADELEQAHKRLRAGLKKVRVRGKKLAR